jgi:hypothetical protein
MENYGRYMGEPMVNSYHVDNERGAVIVLLALAMMALLAFITLAIDSARLSSSYEQGAYYTNLAALTAIDEYYQWDCDDLPEGSSCHNFRMNKAAERVNTLSANNRIASDSTISPTASLDQTSGTGKLTPGIFENNAFGPMAGSPTPNAMNIHGHFFPKSSTIFGGPILGISEFNPEYDATAVYMPKRMVVLVDMSRSMVRQTHGKNPAEPDFPIFQYAYLYDYDRPAHGNNTQSEIPYFYNLPTPRDVDGLPKHFRNDYWYLDSGWATSGMLDDRNYPSYGGSPDWAGFFPDPTSNPVYSTKSQGWKVDIYRSNSYTGPEPITSVLEGASQPAHWLTKRTNPGDRLSVVMFDDKLDWMRTIQLGSNFPKIEDFLQTRTNVSIYAKVHKSTLFHMFPKRTVESFYTQIWPVDSNSTNIKMALQEAVVQLGTINPDTDSILLISDGFHNCLNERGELPNCKMTMDRVRAAWADLDSYISNNIVPLRIPVHVALVGDNARPHTYKVRSAEPGNEECVTDEELRESGRTHEYVNGPKFAGSDPIADWDRYTDPADPLPMGMEISRYMYNIAIRTRGRYKAIRPMDPGCTSGPPPVTDCSDMAQGDPPKLETTDPWCENIKDQLKSMAYDIIGKPKYQLAR